MVHCAVTDCKNGSRRKAMGITFHRFPNKEKDRERYNDWLSNLQRKNWEPRRRSLVCSVHFTPDCFDRTGQTVRLRYWAVPTLFPFRSDLRKIKTGRRSPQRNLPEKDSSVIYLITSSSTPATETSDSYESSDPLTSTSALDDPLAIREPIFSRSTTVTPAKFKNFYSEINNSASVEPIECKPLCGEMELTEDLKPFLVKTEESIIIKEEEFSPFYGETDQNISSSPKEFKPLCSDIDDSSAMTSSAFLPFYCDTDHTYAKIVL